ncbi:MAG: N-acetyltransferase [Clostridia bacterium]|nr:N-acetyltransferase [Clostridia bacterium]
MKIRLERPGDYRAVEEMLRDAFWNLHVPGCHEHYLAHRMRTHADYLPELSLVAEEDGRVVGIIMYTRAQLMDPRGNVKPVLTFGPLCVHPDYQHRGIGKALMDASFNRAISRGWDTVVIFGHPNLYAGAGFVHCSRYNICMGTGTYASSMLVKPLTHASLTSTRWIYQGSPVYNIDEQAAEEFDKSFPPREKAVTPTQEVFYIFNHSVIHPTLETNVTMW